MYWVRPLEAGHDRRDGPFGRERARRRLERRRVGRPWRLAAPDRFRPCDRSRFRSKAAYNIEKLQLPPKSIAMHMSALWIRVRLSSVADVYLQLTYSFSNA